MEIWVRVMLLIGAVVSLINLALLELTLINVVINIATLACCVFVLYMDSLNRAPPR